MSRFSDLVDGVEANLNDPTVPFVKSTPDRKGQHGGRRRVHWYLIGGDIVKASQSGGRQSGDETTPREPAVWNRIEQIGGTVFAESLDSLDALWSNLIVAMDHYSANGGVSFGGYNYNYDQYGQRVPTIEFTITVKLPVTDEQKPLTILTGEEHTCNWDIKRVSIFSPVFDTVFG